VTQVLTGLILENFKTFGGVHPIPLAPLTVIYGANSSGKSSILQALLFLKQNVHLADNPTGPVMLDGPIVDLGGFRQLVHLHQIANRVCVTPLFRVASSNAENNQRDQSETQDTGRVFGIGSSIGLNINNVPCLISWVRYHDLIQAPAEVLPIHARGNSLPKTEGAARQKVLARSAIRGILGLPSEDKLLFLLHILQKCLFHLQDYVIDSIATQTNSGSILEFTEYLIRQIDIINNEFSTPQSGLNETEVPRSLLSRCRKLFHATDGQTIFDDFPSFLIEYIISETDAIYYLNETEFARYRRQMERVTDVGHAAKQDEAPDHDRSDLLETGNGRSELGIDPRSHETKKFLSGIAHIGPARQVQGRFGQFALEPTENVGTVGENLLSVLVSSPDIIEQVNFWLSILSIRYRLSIQIHDKNARLASIVVQDLVSNSTSSLSDVGFGIGQIIPILAELSSSHHGALLIEQPELHLHPSAQGLLARLLIEASRRRQVIIETHSEHLVLAIQRCVQDGDVGFDDVCVLCVSKQKSGTRVQRMELTDDGNFAEPWLDEFFPDRLSLRYGESS